MAQLKSRQVLNIFLASPTDLREEREVAREVVERVNQTLGRRLSYQLELVGWEDTTPGYGRPQEKINADVRACELFLGLVWKRWGSPTGEYSSGFEEEFELAAARRRDSGEKPDIWIFFKRLTPDECTDPGEQLRRVMQFRRRLEEERELLWREFVDLHDFERQLHDHLSQFLFDAQNTAEPYPPYPAARDAAQLPEPTSYVQQILDLQAIAAQGSDPVAEANLANHLGFVYERQGEFGSALAAHRRAMALFRELDHARGVADSLNNVAIVCARRGQLDLALELHHHVLEQRIAAEDHLREGNTRNNIAAIHLRRNQREMAMDELVQAHDIAVHPDVSDDRGAGKALHNRGVVETLNGAWDEATKLFERALILRKQTNDLRGAAKVLNNLGVVEVLGRDRPSDALRYFDQALALFGTIEDRLALANALNNCVLVVESYEATAYKNYGPRLADHLQQLRPFEIELYADYEVITTDLREVYAPPKVPLRTSIVSIASSGSTTPIADIQVLSARLEP